MEVVITKNYEEMSVWADNFGIMAIQHGKRFPDLLFFL